MKVKFLSPVWHDADRFQPGDTADLPKAAAEALITSGAAQASEPPEAKPKSKAKPETQAS